MGYLKLLWNVFECSEDLSFYVIVGEMSSHALHEKDLSFSLSVLTGALAERFAQILSLVGCADLSNQFTIE